MLHKLQGHHRRGTAKDTKAQRYIEELEEDCELLGVTGVEDKL